MVIYKNMKAMVHSLDCDTDSFHNVSIYIIICLDYELGTSVDLTKEKENGFTSKKIWSKRYPAEIMTGTDCTGDLTLLTNTLPQVAGCIGLNVNANKIEFICFR